MKVFYTLTRATDFFAQHASIRNAKFQHSVLALLIAFLSLASIQSLSGQVGNSFEVADGLTTTLNCGSNACGYFDLDQTSPAVAHDLLDNAGIPVNQVGSGAVLGFSTRFTPSRTSGTSTGGLSGDATNFGVAGPDKIESDLIMTGAALGSQAFMMEDTDGLITMTFEAVDLTGAASSMFTMEYFLSSTSWESSDGANDRLYVRIEVEGGPTVNVLDTDGGGAGGGGGNDLDGQTPAVITENAWTQLSADLSLYVGSKVTLIIEFDSNSTIEELGIDAISFTQGTRVPPGVAFTCPTVGTAATSESSVCSNDPFNVTATNLATMAMAANDEQDFGIEFVAFTSTPANPYVGGTSLGTVPFASLSGGGTSASITGATLATASSYEIYAILSPAPTDGSCRPSAMTTVTVHDFPTVAFTAPADLCLGDGEQTGLGGGTPIGGGGSLANNLLGDDFSYADGSLVPFGGWTNLSGTIGDLLVSNGQVRIQHGTPSEDAGLAFTPVSGNIYYGIDFIVEDQGGPITGTDNEYFVHFRTNSAGFSARLDVVPPTGGGDFSVGIASDDSTADAVWPTDLSYGTSYRAIVRYDQDENIAQLWIDATVESDPSITGDDKPNPGNVITQVALRQSDSNLNESILVDNLTVGTTFVSADGSGTGVYSGNGVTDDGNGMTYSFNPATAGVGTHTITYTYTTINGCTSTASDDVEVFGTPTVSISAQTNVSVFGGSNGSATAAGSGGAGAYSYAWSDGQMAAIATGLEAGTYTVSVTDVNNCGTATTTVTITEPAPTAPNLVGNTDIFYSSNTCNDFNPGYGEPFNTSDNSTSTGVVLNCALPATFTYNLCAGIYEVDVFWLETRVGGLDDNGPRDFTVTFHELPNGGGSTVGTYTGVAALGPNFQSFILPSAVSNVQSFSFEFTTSHGSSSFEFDEVALTGTLTTPLAPEIDILGGGPLASIPDGTVSTQSSDGTDFGNVTINTTSSNSFTISNDGVDGSLIISSVEVLSGDTDEFSIPASLNTTILPGGTATFMVAFAPTAVGNYSATIRVISNDCDENPYEFVVSGAGVLPCDIAITSATPTDEACPGADDGTITVVATCTTCTSITYSLSGTASVGPQASNVFAGLADGTYTVTVADSGDGSCTASEMNVVVGAGTDAAPPAITCPGNAADVMLDASCEATVPDLAALASATDNCSAPGNISITQSPAAGMTVTNIQTYDITITAEDEAGQTASCVRSFTVLDRTPILVDDEANLNEDGGATNIDILDNDTEPCGDFSIIVVGTPSSGTLVPNASNELVYTPEDHVSGCFTAEYALNVNPQPTTANNDFVQTMIATLVSVDVLANDTDPQNDPLTPTIITNGTNGVAVINGTMIDYTPSAGFMGQDQVTYQISDGNGNVDQGVITISVIQNQQGTVHYLPPALNSGGGSNVNFRLWINTEDPAGASGTINIGGATVPFSVTNTNTFIHSSTLVTGAGMVLTASRNTVRTDGIIVNSDNPVNVQIANENGVWQSFLNSKSTDALGTEFYAGQITRQNGSYFNANGRNFITLIATEDNTTVTADRPPNATWNWEGVGTPSTTFTLDAGETYLLTAGGSLNKITGAHITSDKPIAMSCGTFAFNINAGDNGWDMSVPVDKVGNEYVIESSVSNPDETDFVATQDDTDVFVNGGLVANLDAGEFYNLNLTSTANGALQYITSSKPVYAYQFSGGVANKGENGMAMVAPVDPNGRGFFRFRTPNPGGAL